MATMFTSAQGLPRLRSFTATIAVDESLSDAVDLAGYVLAAIAMPSSWTAADLTLQAGDNSNAYRDVYDAGDAEVTIQAAASRYILIEEVVARGIQLIKVRSGTTGSPVTQAAARTIYLLAWEASR